mgnify:CR=1 FL=1
MSKFIISIIVFSFSFVATASVKDDFNQATIFYNELNYEEAKTIYLDLLNEGHFSAELYYNLGNVYYKLNEIGASILYYEKASKLDPLNEDIRHNLSFAYKLTVDKNDNIGNELLSAWWGTVVKYQPLNRWALYSVLLLLFSSCLLLLYFVSKQRMVKQIGFYSSVILFVGFILVFSIGVQSKSMLESKIHGIIFNPSVTVLSEPNEQATKLFTLHEGAKVELLTIEKGWQRIQFSEEKIGWVKTGVVQGI